MSLETGFHPLRIREVRRETADAVSILLEAPPELSDLYCFEAGQHLTLRHDLDGQEVRRNYSVCVSPLDGELRIAIKEIEGGRFSAFANQHLKAGDILEVMAPHGRFTWAFDPQASRRYLGVAGGSGITPVLSILKTALAVEPLSRFTLFYGNRTSASIMFLEELAGLKNRYLQRLEIYHFLEDEEEEDVELFNGRLDAARCAQALDGLVQVTALDAAFVCGPGPMMEAAEGALLTRGAPHERILLERFLTEPISLERAAAAARLAERAKGSILTVILEGRRARIAFDPARGSVLESARDAGLPAPYACKGGVCATCRAKVVQGSAEMKLNYGLTDKEVADGYVLTCQAVPTSADLVVDYDA